MFVVETRQAYIGLWGHKYPLIIEQFAGEILLRQGSTQLQYKNSLSGDKEETRTIHQYRSSRDKLYINFGKKDQ